MKEIIVVGLGAGDLNQLPFGVYKRLKEAKTIFLRTKEHPVIQELEKEGIIFHSFDGIYEKHDTFEKVYEEICDTLFNQVEKMGIIVYAVPGHPLVAERTVQMLLKKAPTKNVKLTIEGGQSFLDSLFQALKIDPIEGFQLLDGTSLKRDDIQVTNHIIISQVYDSFTGSNVKLTLMELLPDDYEIFLVHAAGSKEEEIKKIPLYELDRVIQMDNLASIYIPPVKDEKILYKQFFKLREIIAALRGPNGCPWDKKQTHESLKKYLLEEAYELIEAIHEEDIDHMIEELGDVLLQVLLHAQIGEDEGYFSIEDVIESISAKMIRRHPHVFGEGSAESVDEVLRNWQEIKKEEKGSKEKPSILDDVAGKHLPNLMRAYELQKEAAKVGFDWEKVEEAWAKVKEEIKEFEEEMGKGKGAQLEKEFGDVLFALVNVARFYKLNPEEALFRTNQKFIRRFSYVERKVKETGKDFESFTLEELDKFWDEAKKEGL